MRLLIIEDDEKTGQYLTQGLSEASFVVSWVRYGQDGIHEQANTAFDLIILDRMLPDMDGLQVLTTIQSQPAVPPVLLLTAKDSIEDRVKGRQTLCFCRIACPHQNAVATQPAASAGYPANAG